MRLFVAIPLPDALRQAAEESLIALDLRASHWRIVAGSGLHLTLRFLGETEAERAARLDGALAEIARATPRLELALRGAGAFPDGRRPRTLWLGIEELGTGDALAGLAARLEWLARESGFPPETRRFSPHVTLARARGAAPAIPALSTIGALGSFRPDDLVLYRSRTGPRGARYEVVGRYPFGEGPGR
jgi:2'-5' RNA ligase